MVGHVRGKELQRDEAAELGVLGFENLAHASGAEFLDNAIMGNGATNHERRPSWQRCSTAPTRGRS
jgi:hypothetical protein